MTNPAGSTRDASQLAARAGRRVAVCPMPARAVASRMRPDPTRSRSPSPKWASRTRHRAGIPRSISARTTGQASRVDVNRASTLFDGMRRSEYPVASSIRISKPSGNRGPFARAAGTSGRQLAARTLAGATSNCSPDLATDTSRRPELTWPRRPFAQCQSRTRHLGGIPRSISARTAGHASNVDENRPTTLFEGMRRSEYPIAPSTRMSRPSPGGREYRPSWPLLKSYSTELSTSALFVRISFALRGAPCGDDSRPWLAVRGYHDEDAVKIGPTDGSPPVLHDRVFEIGDRPRQRVVHGRLCLIERHAMLPFVLDGLVGVPIETDHTPDTTDRPSPASHPDNGEMSDGP